MSGVGKAMADRSRLTAYVREYSERVWPGYDVPKVTGPDVERMLVRADSYADAHVNFSTNCQYGTAEECGERAAAAEFVEER